MQQRNTTNLTHVLRESASSADEPTSGRDHPVLVVLDGLRTCRRYEIKKLEFFIGRDDGCDIVLHDQNASRRHAKLLYTNLTDPGARPIVVLFDLDSRNGLLVNGKRATNQALQNGDKILIGKTLVGYYVWDDATLRSEDILLRNASTDTLTGLYNRGYFQSALQREFQRALRYNRPLTLGFIDLDHFKKINDTYGLPVGDKVLADVSKLVLEETRVDDFSCRYGGEEIAVILPETAVEGATTLAERMLERIRNLKVPFSGQEIRVTASIGLAEFEPSMREAVELVKLTDVALYRAKQEGRNRICASASLKTVNEATQPLPQLK